ncbi:uncharacterized protein SCHCODRAFT_01177179 [Schizophyllum commune H4-8]|uniref:uncharacterized protein n=1 Tax=Schizophyllum commune (strain H4-8 / FGSC 9210) TaxID=578458 RepID=UPI00215E33C6|nr:uncharacterized protein SCHCODRAFT_01177179 [Schizophyllum commune H4-8]KAI5897198.1 hypothetical protein SCHCODRAFT_01177179 [Schizophyllum commune H4-8]
MSGVDDTDLIQFAGSCSQARDAVQSYRDRVYDLCTALQRYMTIEQARQLRLRMRDNNAVISGSFALRFIGRYDFEEGDLDIYAFGGDILPIGDFLASIGYLFTPRAVQEPHFDSAVSRACDDSITPEGTVDSTKSSSDYTEVETFTFMRGSAKIQLMMCRLGVAETILQFHSTVVMNMITHDTAYSLYPRATFVDKRTLKTCKGDTRECEAVALAKYEQRGWEVVDKMSPIDALSHNTEFGKGFRYVGDEMTRIIKLNNPVSYPGSSDKIKYNSWTLKYSEAVRPRPTSNDPIPHWWFMKPQMETWTGVDEEWNIDAFCFAYPHMADRFTESASCSKMPINLWTTTRASTELMAICLDVASRASTRSALGC